MQERITTTKKGSITSVQAIYVPADDLTDPAPATTFAHLDATTVLSVVSPSVASTPPSTPSTPPPVSWTPMSSELSTTELPVMSRSCCRTTSPSRILLLSWVWTSCLRRTRSRSPGRGRSRGSCLSPSRSLRCLPTTLASLSPLPRPSPASRISLLASTTPCPRVPSTWLATLTRLLPRVRGSQLRLLPTKKLPHLGPSLP